MKNKEKLTPEEYKRKLEEKPYREFYIPGFLYNLVSIALCLVLTNTMLLRLAKINGGSSGIPYLAGHSPYFVYGSFIAAILIGWAIGKLVLQRASKAGRKARRERHDKNIAEKAAAYREAFIREGLQHSSLFDCGELSDRAIDMYADQFYDMILSADRSAAQEQVVCSMPISVTASTFGSTKSRWLEPFLYDVEDVVYTAEWRIEPVEDPQMRLGLLKSVADGVMEDVTERLREDPQVISGDKNWTISVGEYAFGPVHADYGSESLDKCHVSVLYTADNSAYIPLRTAYAADSGPGNSRKKRRKA